MELKDPISDKAYTTKVPCLLPEDILIYLVEKCGLQIPEESCRQYWEHMDSVGEEVAIKSKQFRDLSQNQIWPIGLHGDEATMALQNAPYEKILGVFMNIPIFRPRSTRISRFLLFALETSTMVDVHRSVNPLLERIVVSLNTCTQRGVAGRRYILTEIRGDQVWIRFLFQHHSFWKRSSVCYRCEASTAPTSLNYAIYDGWTSTRRSTEDFLTHELPLEMSFFPKQMHFFMRVSSVVENCSLGLSLSK